MATSDWQQQLSTAYGDAQQGGFTSPSRQRHPNWKQRKQNIRNDLGMTGGPDPIPRPGGINPPPPMPYTINPQPGGNIGAPNPYSGGNIGAPAPPPVGNIGAPEPNVWSGVPVSNPPSVGNIGAPFTLQGEPYTQPLTIAPANPYTPLSPFQLADDQPTATPVPFGRSREPVTPGGGSW
jgi:hypothetical protein